MIDFAILLRALEAEAVEFIIIGGAAGIAHGSARMTLDLDIVYRRTRENLERVARALAPFEPYLRNVPRGLPFQWDVHTLSRGLNFTLVTSAGDLDIFGEIAGGGTYDSLLPDTILLEPFGIPCRCLDLKRLIAVKRAAGRAKDLEAIAELESLLEDETD